MFKCCGFALVGFGEDAFGSEAGVERLDAFPLVSPKQEVQSRPAGHGFGEIHPTHFFSTA